ncbi:hypothetical protein Desaci_0732 [Desulfosporosinus acidiphilus SJ4]|uniref:Uncharacterized protein n=1 Tax=Desulfosporosinus acidiphilus (strain DSM 22704 / JCM 16185 / SJ4) TaxID=646529 RepID=I4D1W9_DESAJ|nr:hypothetical protein [Desulfosporosinus acidiphilus]AFM39793.1 hypothetical protein Desaci_0732 [Desulfosporosinus acidiphilus SJ4]
MNERLNNEEILQRILKTNSDVQRYLDLAPSYKPPLKDNKAKETSLSQILPVKFLRTAHRP